MSVIEKIMALPDGKFKLKSTQIDGLEQTLTAFRSQLSRGYLHGGGDTVIAGTNISITTNSSGQKVISSTLPVLAGVTSLNTLTGAVTLVAGSNVTITPSGNTLTISSSGGGGGTVGPGTTNEIAYFNAPTTIASLPTATYPSLTELSYVKGVTSSIQTQINAKGAGTVTSVSGTTNRISVATGTTTPVIDIDAAYIGQTSITTLGTITTGSIAASHITTGTFGTGAYVMDTSLAVLQIFNADNAQTASSNAITFTRANRNNTVTNNSAATLTITLSTTSAAAGDMLLIQIYDFSAVAQTITWVNTENSTTSVPVISNGSTTLPLTVGFKWNASTSKWRCEGWS